MTYTPTGVRTFSHPFRYSELKKLYYIVTERGSFLINPLAAIFNLGFIAASFVLFLIEERSGKTFHLQLVCGMSRVVYWITATIWDLCTYLIFIVVVVLFYMVFQVRERVREGEGGTEGGREGIERGREEEWREEERGRGEGGRERGDREREGGGMEGGREREGGREGGRNGGTGKEGYSSPSFPLFTHRMSSTPTRKSYQPSSSSSSPTELPSLLGCISSPSSFTHQPPHTSFSSA